MIKYHNIPYSVPLTVVRNVTVHTVYRIVSAVTIPKPFVYRMGNIVIFNRLAGIRNIALHVPPMIRAPSKKRSSKRCLPQFMALLAPLQTKELRGVRGASVKCFGPSVVPLVHCRAFL